MKLASVRTLILTCIASGLAMPAAVAQCQRSSSGSGQDSAGSLTGATPYALNSMSGYNQNTLGANPYVSHVMAQRVAAEQFQQYAAMRAKSAGILVRTQMADARAQRKMIDQASAELRKQREKERTEALALREERSTARRTKEYDKERTQQASARLASVN